MASAAAQCIGALEIVGDGTLPSDRRRMLV
jgi:hypothetical protein